MKFAYADPPYIGQARKHYGVEAKEVNHELLISHLATFDGWALSCSTPSLEEIQHLCRKVVGPNQTRVGGWFKPFASFKPGVNPAYCWEPVLFVPGRNRGRDVATTRDYFEMTEIEAARMEVAVKANITLKRGTSGAKPDRFNCWLFEILGIVATDEFHDLFPGSGAVSRAWQDWSWHNTPAEAAV